MQLQLVVIYENYICLYFVRCVLNSELLHTLQKAVMSSKVKSSQLLLCLKFYIIATTCTALPAPSNGKKLGCPGSSAVYNDTVCQFSCDNGYKGSGSQVRKCQQNGTWSGQDFTCEGNVCK